LTLERMSSAAKASDGETVNNIAMQLFGLGAREVDVMENYLAERSDAHMSEMSTAGG
jgi:hypothetical protein